MTIGANGTPSAGVTGDLAAEAGRKVREALSVNRAEEQARADGWANVATGLGQLLKDPRGSTTFDRRGFGGNGDTVVTRAMIEALYEQSEVFPRMIDAIPEHATRRWIRIAGGEQEKKDDEDFGQMLLDELERVGARWAFSECMRLDRLYGGARIVLGINDGGGPEEELREDRVQSIEFINVVSRHLLMPLQIDRNPMSRYFRQPRFYQVIGGDGSIARIHASRTIGWLPHRAGTDSSLYQRNGWDAPILERVLEAVRAYGTMFAAVEALIQDLNQGVVTIKDLARMLSTPAAADGGAPAGDEVVMNRLKAIAYGRSIFNMIVLDADETYERRPGIPTGLETLILRFMDRLAAAAEMPLSKLFGAAPSGLSTDDESGRKSFNESISVKQDKLLRPGIKRLADLLIAAREGPFRGQAPKRWGFEFNPLEDPNPTEEATARLTRAKEAETWHAMGAITAREARSALRNDPSRIFELDSETDDAMEELDALPHELQGKEQDLVAKDLETAAKEQSMQIQALEASRAAKEPAVPKKGPPRG